jgi:hypothetical protein
MRPFISLRTDEDGAVSTEFVIIFPLLTLWLLSSFVWYDAFRSNSLTAKVAYTISDVSSRYEQISVADMTELYNLHKKLLPGRVRDGYLRVSSICWNGTRHRVLWSFLGDETYLAAIADPDDELEPRLEPLQDEDVPLGLMPQMSVNDSIILTDVYGEWHPLSTKAMLPNMTWKNSLVTRPRFKDIVALSQPLEGYPHAQDVLCPEEPPET